MPGLGAGHVSRDPLRDAAPTHAEKCALAFKEVSACIGRHDTRPSYAHAFLWLIIDLSLNAGFFALSYGLVSGGYVHWMLYWPVYAYVQGTLMTGPWVLAHECGHNAFSPSKTVNDVVGYILHTALLVPYFSWQFSHNKHHKYTNHMTKGETHVPHTKEDFIFWKLDKFHEILGEDAFALFSIFFYFTIGWPLYLFLNLTGGRVKGGDEKKPLDGWMVLRNHFFANEIFPDRMGAKVHLSTLGLVAFLTSLLYCFGWPAVAYWYAGPYVVSNGWLVMYTYLQHTSVDVPHFNTDDYTHFMGAVSTFDRPYNALTNLLHHHIGSSHVVHHINFRIPFHRAVELTPKVAEILKKYGLYNYDSRPALYAFFDTAKKCNYVENADGVQYFKSWGEKGAPNMPRAPKMPSVEADIAFESDKLKGA